MSLKSQEGITLTEVVVSTAVAVIVAGTAVTVATPMLARERLRSATYQLQSSMEVSRVEAVNRNRPTRFVFDENQKTLEVWDTRGTSTTADDQLLRRDSLPASVSLARPEVEHKDAITIAGDLNGDHEAVFAADGSVTTGTGEIALYGGGQYQKLTLYGAGGVDVERWVDESWQSPEKEFCEERIETKWEEVREGYEDDWDTTKEEYYEDPDPVEDPVRDPVTDPVDDKT